MPHTQPADVDITVGYEDGSMRTYVIHDFIAEPNLKIMRIQPHSGPIPPPVSFGRPDISVSATIPYAALPFPFDATVVAANVMVWTGIGLALYHAAGPYSLLGLGLFILWCRQVWLRALMKKYAKQNSQPRQSS